MRRALTVLFLALVLLGVAPAAFAQGCAMCRTSAEAADEPGKKALNLAILVLLIPTTSIFGGVLYWAFRKRDRSWNEDTPPPVRQIEEDSFWRSFGGQ
jgi:cbb3-type cytochrome oxidase subunit 3